MVIHSVTSVCVAVYPVQTITSESLDVQTSFSVCRYIVRISMSRLRSWHQSQGHMNKHTYTSGLPSTEMQACSNCLCACLAGVVALFVCVFVVLYFHDTVKVQMQLLQT